MIELKGSLPASVNSTILDAAKPKLKTGDSDSAAVSHTKLIEQFGDMDFHGALCEIKIARDLFV